VSRERESREQGAKGSRETDHDGGRILDFEGEGTLNSLNVLIGGNTFSKKKQKSPSAITERDGDHSKLGSSMDVSAWKE